MSLAQNIFTTTQANETNFVITWTPPYYMNTSAVKAEVDEAPWTVVAVSGTTVTLETGIPSGSIVRIYRNTDITDNEVNFLPGSPFRAEDINANFDQILFSLQENVTINENQDIDIDNIFDTLNDLLVLINNSIQYVRVPDIAALNDVALTDPDNLKTYEVANSTGAPQANPPIVGLPPQAGGGPGEEPVTGVYWDSGIITRVSWNKANQEWTYLFYYSSNSDNRYQQITITDPETPDPNDYKDGTLWFDSGDGNLYVLYNDGNSRQWVITNPLSAYGQIVTSDDVYWSRDASFNSVYPKNSSDTVANDNVASTWSINADGSAQFAGSQIKCGNYGSRTTVGVGTNVFSGSKAATIFIKGEDASDSAEALVVQNGNDPDNDVVLSLTYGGSGTFSGVTRIGDPDNADPTSSAASGVRISNNGLVKIKKSAGGSAFSVVDENNATNVLIGTNGNAELAGDVLVGKTSTDPNTARGIRIKDAGSFNYLISNDVQSGGGVATVYQHLLNGGQTLALNGDGSAMFAGGLANIYNNGTIRVGTNPGSSGSFGADLNTNGQVRIRTSETEALRIFPNTGENDSISLNSDGTATFASTVTCGPGDGVAVDGKGAGVFYRATSTTTNNIFVAQSDVGDTQSTAAFITAAGEATFTGDIDAGDVDAGAGSRVGTKSITTRRNNFTTPNQVSLNAGVGGEEYSIVAFPTGTSDVTFGVKIDGSAKFAGLIDGPAAIFRNYADSYNSNTALCSAVNNVPYSIVVRSASSAAAFWGVSPTGVTTAIAGATYGGNVETPNIILNLDLDNDANYVSTTDAEGNETRVYNGPTLDVKTVIQELQQRVDARDAVIADLTTRIQTLEGGNN